MKRKFDYKGITYQLLDIDDSKLTEAEIEQECNQFIKSYKYCGVLKSIKKERLPWSKEITWMFFKNGKLHNENGPSVMTVFDKTQNIGEVAKEEYYLDGVKFEYEEWITKTHPEKRLKIVK
jgi:hypothetical protein